MYDKTPTGQNTSNPDQELEGYLRHMFDSSEQDAQAMARIRERLQIASAGTLPAPLPVNRRKNMKHAEQTMWHIPTIKETTWIQRLSAIAAVILVAALVGSLVLLLHLRQTSEVGGNKPINLYPGWSQMAFYTGTGSKTINNLNINLPQTWGYTYTCSGSGSIEMKITGAQTDFEFGKGPCRNLTPATSSPRQLSFDFTPQHFQKIQVTASATASWSLQIVQEAIPHTLVFGTGWIFGNGMGGDTSSMSNGPGFHDTHGKQVYPQTLGLAMLCIGTGKGTVQILPNTAKTSLPACNGQPTFTILHYKFEANTLRVQVQVTGKITFYATVLGCIDQHCTYSQS